jgi:hypothetical protein
MVGEPHATRLQVTGLPVQKKRMVKRSPQAGRGPRFCRYHAEHTEPLRGAKFSLGRSRPGAEVRHPSPIGLEAVIQAKGVVVPMCVGR